MSTIKNVGALGHLLDLLLNLFCFTHKFKTSFSLAGKGVLGMCLFLLLLRKVAICVVSCCRSYFLHQTL